MKDADVPYEDIAYVLAKFFDTKIGLNHLTQKHLEKINDDFYDWYIDYLTNMQGHELHALIGSLEVDHYAYVGRIVDRKVTSFKQITRKEMLKVRRKVLEEWQARKQNSM